MGARPVHTAALQPHFDHHLVSALRAAAADRVARRLERCVLHLHQTFGEVRHGSIARRRCQARIGRPVDRQACQGSQHLADAVSGVLERVRLLVQPRRKRGRSDTEARLGSRGEMLDRVWKIQDPHRVRSQHVHQPLQPFGAVLHRTHDTRRFGAAPIRLHIRQACERLSVRQT